MLGPWEISKHLRIQQVSTAAIVTGEYFYHRKGGKQHIPEICSFLSFSESWLLAVTSNALLGA